MLSIQSHVSYGHAGNSAAVFPLQRLGVDVWPVHTVCFSNHTGYLDWEGTLLPAEDIAAVVQGIDRREALSRVDAVLSGYQGAEDVGAKILEAVALVKERRPGAIWCCDPVMGDVGRGFFVRPGIPEFMRDQVVPAADVVTPNHFELDFLTGRETTSLAEVRAAIDALRAVGPETVLATSVASEDVPAGSLSMIAANSTGAWRVVTPELNRTFTGSGDLTAAIFLRELLEDKPVDVALAETAARVYGVLAATTAAGTRELQLVAAQQEIAEPTNQFEVIALD